MRTQSPASNTVTLSIAIALAMLSNNQNCLAQAQSTQDDSRLTSGISMNFQSVKKDDNLPLAKLRQQDPSNLLKPDKPLPTIDGNANYSSRQDRRSTAKTASWTQPTLRHRRLYFEDSALERCNEARKYGNLASGVHFFKSVFRFPLRIVSGR